MPGANSLHDTEGCELYFRLIRGTEPPLIFRRWAYLSALATWLGQRVWYPFGSSRIFPNMYVMFVGEPGTRKSTAIKDVRKLLHKAGYTNFGPQKTSKEKFLTDLQLSAWSDEQDEVEDEWQENRGRKQTRAGAIDILKNLRISGVDEDGVGSEPSEVLIAADEFNNFLGPGNIEFQSILGELWDWDEPERRWTYRLKNSKSVAIFQPTINILSGNTPTQFAECFPPSAIGQGFMSRLILIHSESSGIKCTEPPVPDTGLSNRLIQHFVELRIKFAGPLGRSSEAFSALDTIYKSWRDLEDDRFRHYSSRRFTHLLKICLLVACDRLADRIEIQDVIYANTLLAFAETTMSKAIGDMGKSRHAEATSKVMTHLYSAKKAQTVMDLWKVAMRDVDSIGDLAKILANLEQGDKIQRVKVGEKEGFLPKTRMIRFNAPYVNFDLLKGKEM